MPKQSRPRKKPNATKIQPPSSHTRQKKRAPPFTADQTNKVLAAVLDKDPWNADYGQRENAWMDAVEELNKSRKFPTRLTKSTVRDKIRACVALHEGKQPERTVFSDSEGFIFHSLIDKIRGRMQAARDNKDSRAQKKNNRDIRLDCDGHRARTAALTTHMQQRADQEKSTDQVPLSVAEVDQPADAPMEHPESSPEPPENSGDPSCSVNLTRAAAKDTSSDVSAILSALQHVNTVQGQRFEQFMGVLVDQQDAIAKLAHAQVESNRLLRCVLENAGIDMPVPKRTPDTEDNE
ncbi:hypothetical protein RhiJN_10773 [Ceratobasidium sp. AG-Ba]|nr:hypothetical protein RhiJN_10773 [Ceratobasidium sp. AG-Ba]